jgi:hypothetical protein
MTNELPEAISRNDMVSYLVRVSEMDWDLISSMSDEVLSSTYRSWKEGRRENRVSSSEMHDQAAKYTEIRVMVPVIAECLGLTEEEVWENWSYDEIDAEYQRLLGEGLIGEM